MDRISSLMPGSSIPYWTPGKVLVPPNGQFTWELDQTLVKQSLSQVPGTINPVQWELVGDREGAHVIRRFINLKYTVRYNAGAIPTNEDGSKTQESRANAVVRVLLWARKYAAGPSLLAPTWDPQDPQYVASTPTNYTQCTPLDGPKFPGSPHVNDWLNDPTVNIISNHSFSVQSGHCRYKTLNVKTPFGRRITYGNLIPDVSQMITPESPGEANYREARLDPKYRGGDHQPIQQDRLYFTLLCDSPILLEDCSMRLYYTDA